MAKLRRLIQVKAWRLIGRAASETVDATKDAEEEGGR